MQAEARQALGRNIIECCKMQLMHQGQADDLTRVTWVWMVNVQRAILSPTRKNHLLLFPGAHSPLDLFFFFLVLIDTADVRGKQRIGVIHTRE